MDGFYGMQSFCGYGAFDPPPQPPPLAGIQLIQLGSGNGGGGSRKRKLSSSSSDQSDGERKMDPFAPECSVPLPFQLADEYGFYGPTAVWKRNERERHRVRCVNEAYDRLRQHLPFADCDKEKRSSKVETLRMTIRYISHLEKMLAEESHWQHCRCFDNLGQLPKGLRCLNNENN